MCLVIAFESQKVVQLLETAFVNLINYASLVTTNAARHRFVAGKSKLLLEFGLRRAQVFLFLIFLSDNLKLEGLSSKFCCDLCFFMSRVLMVVYQLRSIATWEDLMQQGDSLHKSPVVICFQEISATIYSSF